MSATVLIVGCGCRGRSLGRVLVEEGWPVRGTTREERGLEAIEAEGIEPIRADPDRARSIIDLLDDVEIVVWLMGAALAEPEIIAGIHGPRLERVLEALSDAERSRGFVYEKAGRVQDHWLEQGAALVTQAGSKGGLETDLLEVLPGAHEEWLEAALTAVRALAGRI